MRAMGAHGRLAEERGAGRLRDGWDTDADGGVTMAKGIPWTAREDAILRELIPKHGPSWAGWRKELPNRTPDAIAARRKTLGLKGPRGRYGGTRKQSMKPRAEWTEQQRCAMLFHATAMAKDSGHTFAECIAELARLQREHCKQR